MTTLSAAAIAVLVLCGVALIIVVAMLVYCWIARNHTTDDSKDIGYGVGQQNGSHVLILQPTPGRYEAPLEVSCSADGTNYTNFFVHITCGHQKEAGFTQFVEPIQLAVAGTYTFSVFAVTDGGDETPIETYQYTIVSQGDGIGLIPPPGTYTVPLTIDAGNAFRAGAYVAATPTFPPATKDGKLTIDVSGVHAILVGSNHFEAEKGPSRYIYRLLPQPPIFVPGNGSEITDSTMISIQPAMPTIDPEAIIRYSLDGSYPSVPYIGPFYPPGTVIASGGRVSLTVKAIAIGRDGTTSKIVAAVFSVLSSGCAVFDPSVPEPTCVVAAVDPFITFEHPQLTAGDPIAIFYAFGETESKQWRVGEHVKPPGSAIMQLRAWAVDVRTGARSSEAVYMGSRATLEKLDAASTGKGSKQKSSKGGKAKRQNSVASPQAPEISAPVRPPDSSSAIVAPSIICGCSGVRLQFDPSQGDECVLRYTLNGTEPDEESPQYVEGSAVDITSEVTMNGGQVYVVARYYVKDDPKPGQPPHVSPVVRFVGDSYIMVIKWATFTYKTVLLPSFYSHHVYWQRKVALDRALERRSGWSNMFLGIILGSVAYVIVSPFKPNQVPKATYELNGDAAETLALLGIDPKQELAAIALGDLKHKVVAKIHIANDQAEIRKHRLEVEALKGLQSAASSATSAAGNATATLS